MDKDDIKRYGVLVIGISLSLGFAFGAVNSFSSMVDAPAAQQPGQQDIEMPEERLADNSFGLGPEEQHYLAFSEEVVFVNLYYENEEQREQLESIRQELDENFQETVYVAIVSEEENDMLVINFGLDEMPSYAVVGSNQQDPLRSGEGGVTYEETASAVCDVMESWDDHAGYCQSV